MLQTGSGVDTGPLMTDISLLLWGGHSEVLRNISLLLWHRGAATMPSVLPRWTEGGRRGARARCALRCGDCSAVPQGRGCSPCRGALHTSGGLPLFCQEAYRPHRKSGVIDMWLCCEKTRPHEITTFVYPPKWSGERPLDLFQR